MRTKLMNLGICALAALALAIFAASLAGCSKAGTGAGTQEYRIALGGMRLF